MNTLVLIDWSKDWFDSQAGKRAPAVGEWCRQVLHKHYIRKGKVEWVDSTEAGERVELRASLSHILITNSTVSTNVPSGLTFIQYSSLEPHARIALENGAILVEAPPPSDVQIAELRHMLDFVEHYHMQHPGKDLKRISVPQCMKMVSDWNKELLKQKNVEAILEGTTKLYSDEKGYTCWLLSTVEAVENEGQRIGNCMKTNARSLLYSGTLVVVRDPEGHSIAAGEVVLNMRHYKGEFVTVCIPQQFLGPSNSLPSDEALRVMAETCSAMKWRSDEDMAVFVDPAALCLSARVAQEMYDEGGYYNDDGIWVDTTEANGRDEGGYYNDDGIWVETETA